MFDHAVQRAAALATSPMRSLADREELSRGLMAGESLRIAHRESRLDDLTWPGTAIAIRIARGGPRRRPRGERDGRSERSWRPILAFVMERRLRERWSPQQIGRRLT